MKHPKTSAGFEYLDHTADVWVHAWGPNLEGAFEQTALALMDTMIESSNIRPKEKKRVKIEDHSKGSLLVAFLSEFLYLFDIDNWIFSKITVKEINKKKSDNYSIEAVTYGETFNRERHVPDTEVKAITYSYLEIKEHLDWVEIKIVFDI
jgi:SHS2 domain-containing protein